MILYILVWELTFIHFCVRSNSFDLCVGYQFVNMLYRCEQTSTLQADHELLNDAHEQTGGGGEPMDIFYEEEENEIQKRRRRS
jgi:hypothetical protein